MSERIGKRLLLLAQVLAELLGIVHVLHDLVLEGIMRSLQGIVVIEGFLNLRWRGAEGKEGQNVVTEVVVESAQNQAAFW